jgi:N-acetylmuramoyl-L-alanine amidase
MVWFTRREWDARELRGHITHGPKALVVFHHFLDPDVRAGVTLATEREMMRHVEWFHTHRRHWDGIAYNWVIFQSGHAYQGRGWGWTGAHTEGHNSASVGVAFAVDGTEHRLTPAAREAARLLLAEGVRLGHLTPDFEIKGHRDFGDTECPGRLIYPVLADLRPGPEGQPCAA